MSNEYKKSGLIFIVSAPSGAGKTSLVRELIKDRNDLRLSVSHTTRKSRKNEKNGVDYFFVTENEFLKMENGQEFLETADVFGNKYGTSKKNIEQTISLGLNIILDIDWQGARELKKSKFKSVSIFILPPTLKILNQRLRNRGDDPAEIKARMKKAVTEISHYREYDYVITNEVFEDTVTVLDAIITSSHCCSSLHDQELKQSVAEIIENK